MLFIRTVLLSLLASSALRVQLSLHWSASGQVEEAIDGWSSSAENEADRASAVLMAAVNNDPEQLLSAVEASDEDFNVRDAEGRTAVFLAVENAAFESLLQLISLGADLNIVTEREGYTALMKAAAHNDREMVEVLLAAGADPLVRSHDGDCALSIAYRGGRLLVQAMMAEAAALAAMGRIDVSEDHHHASRYAASLLMDALRRGAYINLRNENGFTALMIAAARNDVEMMRELLRMGADVDIRENDGWTALHFAAASGAETIVQLLVEANADNSLRTFNGGLTAREMAEQMQLPHIVDAIPRRNTKKTAASSEL